MLLLFIANLAVGLIDVDPKAPPPVLGSQTKRGEAMRPLLLVAMLAMLKVATAEGHTALGSAQHYRFGPRFLARGVITSA